MVIAKVEMADSGQFTCLAENIAGEARSTADLVIRPAGSEPGNYFHVTKVHFTVFRTFAIEIKKFFFVSLLIKKVRKKEKLDQN